jgi:hypothetical protein
MCCRPAGVAVRQRFDELASNFPQPARTYPVVTRSLNMLWRLLRHRPLLALMPLNLARPLLDEGALVELRVGDAVHIEPIGILQPKAGEQRTDAMRQGRRVQDRAV